MSTTSRAWKVSLLLALALGVSACQSTGGKPANTQPVSPPEPKSSSPENLSVPELRALLQDSDITARIRAVDELGRRASSSPEAVEALVGALGDPAPLVRRFAAGGLANVPSPSAPTLLALARLLSDPELDPRESAARSLATLAPRAPSDSISDLGIALAAAAAGSKEESVRSHAVEALGGLGERGARLVPAIKPALERALNDPSEEVRAAAAAAVGQLGAGVPGTVALLTKALADPSHVVRKHAVVALEKMGPDAAPATKALVRLLHGQEIYLRVFAADAITAIGPGARAALPALKAMAAHGWKEIENSPEMEARQLPEAVARAIKSVEARGAKKVKRSAVQAANASN